MTGDRYSHVSAPAARGRWHAPTAGGPLRATVTVPGSKSLTNRELILAALADGPSKLAAPLHSDDSARMIDALRTLGVGIEAIRGRRPVRRRPGRDAGVAAAGLDRRRLRSGRHRDAVRGRTRRIRARRRDPHRARERAASADGHHDQGPARRRRRHRRRRALGAALHRARPRARARRRGRRRRERVQPVRLGPAAGRTPLRRGPAPDPPGRAPAEHAAHRHDDRGPRRTAACTSSAPRPANGWSPPGRSARRTSRSSPTSPTPPPSWPRPWSPAAASRSPAGRRTRRSPARCSPRSWRSWAPAPSGAAARSPSPPEAGSPASTSTSRLPVSSPRRSWPLRPSPTRRAPSTASDTSADTRPTASRRSSASCVRSAARRTSCRTASASSPARCTAEPGAPTTTTGSPPRALSSVWPSRASRSTTSARPPRRCREFPQLWQDMLAGSPDDAHAEPVHNLAS